MEPLFLTVDEVIEIHQDQIARHGGSEGIRDVGLLHSALAMPMASFGGQFLHTVFLRWPPHTYFTWSRITHFLMATSELEQRR